MRKCALFILWLLASCASAFAAPSVSSISANGSDGGVATISGASFGTHAGIDSIWFLGGKDGWIETTAEGTDPINAPSTTRIYANQGKGDHVDTSHKWSGNKAINLEVNPAKYNGSWESTWAYKRPGGFNKIFVSFWYRFDIVVPDRDYYDPGTGRTTNSQHKFMTITTDSYQGCDENIDPLRSNNMVLYDGEFWTAQRSIGGGNPPGLGAWNVMLSCVNNGSQVVYSQAQGVGYQIQSDSYWRGRYTGGASNWSTVPRYNIENGLWQRVDIYLDVGSWDQHDGYVWRKLVKPSGPHAGQQYSIHLRDVLFMKSGLGSGCARCDKQLPDSVVWYNLYNNTVSSTNTQVANSSVDDPYIQVGTQARVELGNSPIYDDCTLLEMQKPTSWSNNQITVTLNHGGSFRSGDTAYLFVIDENGVASAGRPVVLGVADSLAPGSPGNLRLLD